MQQTAMWKRAAEMAAQTPADRNRYVDLLRALSIGAVVLGHWIMAAPYFLNGVPSMDHLLEIQPWSRWLTLAVSGDAGVLFCWWLLQWRFLGWLTG